LNIRFGVAVKVGKVGRALTPAGALAWCISNKKKCDDIIDDTVEIVCDVSGVCTAERKDDDYNNDSNLSDEKCLMYSTDGDYYYDLSKVLNDAKERVQKSSGKTLIMSQRDIIELQNKSKSLFNSSNSGAGSDYVRLYYKQGDEYKQHTVSIKVSYKTLSNDNCNPGSDNVNSEKNHKQLSKDELTALAKKIAEKMDDDDIKNYYNTKYDDIIINNNHYYGDEINRETNIDKYCESNACNEISKEIEQDIKDKKYDIDDVNEKNCTMEENTGKYIACNMTINNEEENTQTPPKDDTDTPKKEDDDPLSCDSSKFHKKICEWMDWTQDDLEVPDEDKPKIKDLSDDLQIDKNRVNFGRACPVGDNLALSLHGISISHQISYQGLCDAFTTMRPFIIGIGGIISVMIIGGRRV